ncbi:hypothetical protein BHM03_00002623 [Ensete ventricosum]|nr:hypothetical protein BHM03_00002623 [Ensete ventricosum]
MARYTYLLPGEGSASHGCRLSKPHRLARLALRGPIGSGQPQGARQKRLQLLARPDGVVVDRSLILPELDGAQLLHRPRPRPSSWHPFNRLGWPLPLAHLRLGPVSTVSPMMDLCLETLVFFLRPINSSMGRLLGTSGVLLALSTDVSSYSLFRRNFLHVGR